MLQKFWMTTFASTVNAVTDKERFASLLALPPDSFHMSAGVGTLSEKYLHALLKHFFEPDSDYHEVAIGTYTADICRDNKIIEIQTRAFNRLRDKLEYYLLEGYDVTVVLPLPRVKYLIWIDNQTGDVTNRRRSPKKGRFVDAIFELYKIKYFLDWKNLHIKLLLCDLEEYRNLDGYGKNRKYRSTRLERVPLELADTLSLDSVDDYCAFIPDTLPQFFTISDFAKASKIDYGHASTTLNILTYLNLVQKVGKDGKKNLYQVTPK